MSALKENLATLSTKLPELQVEVESLIAETGELEGEVAAYASRLSAREGLAGEIASAVQQALERVRESLAQERGTFEEAGTQLVDRFTGGEEALGAGGEELDGGVAEAAAAAGRLEGALAELATRTATGAAEAAQQIATLAQGGGAGGRELQAAHEAAALEAEALRGAVGETETALAQAVSGLGERLRALAMQATGRSAQLLEKLSELQSLHEGEVPAAAGRLGSGQRELLDGVRERIEQGVQQLVAASALVPIEGLGRLATAGEEAAARCRDGRETVEALFGRLRETVRPLPQAIDSVKEAAVKVGLGWS
jgi:chromosome segregation ATPase